MDNLQPNPLPRKRPSNTSLNSGKEKRLRLEPAHQSQYNVSKKEVDFLPLNDLSHCPMVSVTDTDGKIQSDDMSDILTKLSQLKIERRDHDKQQAELGRRETKTSRMRVRTSDRVWCCACEKYRRAKSNTCRRCQHCFDGCDNCESQHRRDDDDNSPLYIGSP